MENIYPKASITRSYSRTEQVKQFTPIQGFASLNYSWFDKHPTPEEYTEKGKELWNLCVAMVEADVQSQLEVLRGGQFLAPTTKLKAKSDSVELDLDEPLE